MLCEAFPNALVDHEKVIAYGLKRVATCISKRMAPLVEATCEGNLCDLRTIEANENQKLRHACQPQGRKRRILVDRSGLVAEKLDQLPKAFQVHLWRAHRCHKFQFYSEMKDSNPLFWNH